MSTQEISYSISHLLDTVITQWLDSDSVVTVDNCQQHGDWVANIWQFSHRAASS